MVVLFLGVCFIVDLQWNNILTTYERRLNVCLLGLCVQKKRAHSLTHRVIGKACNFLLFYIWWNSWFVAVKLQV